jgi:hypothetical protein
MGESARPVIEEALAALGIETRLGIEPGEPRPEAAGNSLHGSAVRASMPPCLPLLTPAATASRDSAGLDFLSDIVHLYLIKGD